MKKNYFTILFLAIISLTVAGCSISNKKTNENQQNNDQKPVQNAGDEQMNRWNENFSEGSLSDLKISQKVSVMGTKNANGSIAANQIIIGDSETDFNELGENMRSGGRNATNTNLENNLGSQPPQRPEGQSPNFEQFQNMTGEERAKLRPERMAGGMGRGAPANIDQKMARLNGEILDKDDTSLTLKLATGGSKLIFFTEDTKILRPKE